MNEKFIAIVQESGISQYKLSQISGVPFSTINGFMTQTHDINRCSAATLSILATCLKTDVEMLLNPFPLMDKVQGEYENIKYSWKKRADDYMDIIIKDNGLDVTISLDYKCNQPSQRESYTYIAEMLIDKYLREKEIDKKLEEMLL